MFGSGSQNESGAEASGSRTGDRERQEAKRRFLQLKPICVDLLALLPVGRDKDDRRSHDQIAEKLQRLTDKLVGFDADDRQPKTPPLSLALINYVFFPLAKMMREWPEPPDRIRALQFGVITCLAQDWWQAWTAAGIGEEVQEQWKVWGQLVFLCAMALTKDDGRDVTSEETVMAVLTTLETLLSPRMAVEEKGQASKRFDEWEWDGEEALPDLDDYDREMSKLSMEDSNETKIPALIYPSDAQLKHVYEDKRCRNAVAHAMTVAIDLARSSDRPRSVRYTSLRVVRILLQVWVEGSVSPSEDIQKIVISKQSIQRRVRSDTWSPAGRADRVLLYLPGVTSAVIKIATSPKVAGEILSEALTLLRCALVTSLDDDVIAQRSSIEEDHDRKPTSLEELIMESSTAHVQEGTDVTGNDESGDETELYSAKPDSLAETLRNVAVALRALQPLRQNESAAVQHALIEIAGGLLSRCWLACQRSGDASLPRRLLGWLASAASDESSSKWITDRATDLAVNVTRSRPKLLRQELAEEMKNWSHLLISSRRNEGELTDAANRIVSLLRLVSGGVEHTRYDPEAVRLLTTPAEYERWTFSLITSIRLDHSAAVQTELRLSNVDAATNRAVMRAFREMGRAAARGITKGVATGFTPGIVEHLYRLSVRLRVGDSRLSLNASLLACEMLSGMAEILDESMWALKTGKDAAQIRKRASKAARAVVAIIVGLWQAEEDSRDEGVDDAQTPLTTLSSEERAIVLAHTDAVDNVVQEYTRGVRKDEQEEQLPIKAGPSLNVDFVHAAKLLKEHRHGNRVTSNRLEVWYARSRDKLLLRSLAYAAQILGQGVRPLLMDAIYPMVSALASTDDMLSEAASASIQRISHAAGYASIQGCLLDHADYILGAACHRLISGLGQELQIRAAAVQSGEDKGVILAPMTNAMSAPVVLVQMIRSLGSDVVALVEDAIDEVLDAIDRFHGSEEVCDNLLNVLDKMLEAMLEQEQGNPTTLLPSPPDAGFQADNDKDFDDFAQWYRENKDRNTAETSRIDEEEVSQPAAAEEETTVTRTQEVTVAMLRKAIPFLSHHSRTIRLRCLRLLNRGIELLCRQGLKVEPLSVIDATWSILMRRMGFGLDRILPAKIDRVTPDALDEKDFFVAVEAVKVVSTVARYLMDYVGRKRIFEQAIPRLLLLTCVVERWEGAQVSSATSQPTTFLLNGDVESHPSSSALVKSTGHFRPLRPHSPLAILCEYSLTTLDTLVSAAGPSITESDLFAFATHPTLLSCLDKRQVDRIRDRASHFYHRTLKARNAPMVWFVMRATRATVGYPPFLARPELSLPVM